MEETCPTKALLRFVAVSDTHGAHDRIALPQHADVFIHAGDVTTRGNVAVLQQANHWLHDEVVEVLRVRPTCVLAVTGNHDVPGPAGVAFATGVSAEERAAGRIDVQRHLSHARVLQDQWHGGDGGGGGGGGGSAVVHGWCHVLGVAWDAMRMQDVAHWTTVFDQATAAHGRIHVLVTHVPPAPPAVDGEDTPDQGRDRLKHSSALRDALVGLGDMRPLVHVCGHVHNEAGVTAVDASHWMVNAASVKSDGSTRDAVVWTIEAPTTNGEARVVWEWPSQDDLMSNEDSFLAL